MKIELKPEGADDFDDLAKLAIELLNHIGENQTFVSKVKFTFNNKKFVLKKGMSVNSIKTLLEE